MQIGIDLGTTFSCVAYIEEDGIPHVISNSDGMDSTPSVIWFDGRAAVVGKKANDRKITPSSLIYEFIKRDIGKPKFIDGRYEKNGFYYGPTGYSAIILRKLKKEAFNFFRKKGWIPQGIEEKSMNIHAVITVPAYFGDRQRYETRNAGIAAGLDVIAIINEPTAAAIAYGRSLKENRKIMVFDLGGGTFDVTILEVHDGEGIVIASDGADQLGGIDWDELIIQYLYVEYYKRTGKQIPDDMGFEIQQKAIQAKLELSESEKTLVTLSAEGNDVEIELFRSSDAGDEYDEFDMDSNRPFYFEERSSNLLSLCRTICIRVIEKSGLTWGHIDDIVLAGGSCRMPMVPAMLENLTRRKIPRDIPGFSYDTAIAIGAAIYGAHRSKVKDVTSKTIGIEVKVMGRKYIEHLIEKNKPLPVQFEQSFKAENNAVLKIFEGDGHLPEECILRGRLELGNPEGIVKVTMLVNEDGVLVCIVEFAPDIRRELRIETDDGNIDIAELKDKISGIDIRL